MKEDAERYFAELKRREEKERDRRERARYERDRVKQSDREIAAADKRQRELIAALGNAASVSGGHSKLANTQRAPRQSADRGRSHFRFWLTLLIFAGIVGWGLGYVPNHARKTVTASLNVLNQDVLEKRDIEERGQEGGKYKPVQHKGAVYPRCSATVTDECIER